MSTLNDVMTSVYKGMYSLSTDRNDENFPEITARYTVAVAKSESFFLIIQQSKRVS
jgi:hypothetical protein